MIVFIIIISIVGGLSLLLLSFLIVLYFTTFYNGKRNPTDYTPIQGPQFEKYNAKPVIDGAVALPFEEVHVKSYDGLDLYGRYYHSKDGAPINIQFNGYKGNGLRDMAGGLQLCLELGYNVLLVDQRAHGFSEGKSITFGVKERFDVLTWINYVIDRFGKDSKILIQGISMGAATVMMACTLELPKNVIGVVADCPYSSPKGIIRRVMKVSLHLNDRIIYPFMYLSALILAHFKISDATALEGAKMAKIPVLIIHGTADMLVPIEMSEEMVNANPEYISIVKVEGAPHGLSFLENNELYRKSVISFYKKVLGE